MKSISEWKRRNKKTGRFGSSQSDPARAIWGLRFGAVYRVLRVKEWLVHQRGHTPDPRAQRLPSRAPHCNHRWAMDVKHVPCGRDGWDHLTAVIDCHDREILGYEFALRGRVKEAEQAIEAACLARFGTLRPVEPTPVLCSDNCLILQSCRFRQACRNYRLRQEYITALYAEQNGLLERFFRSLKEECVWQHRFTTFDEANGEIRNWMQWYNEGRPHQALRYRSPRHIARNNTHRWFDFRGALHCLSTR